MPKCGLNTVAATFIEIALRHGYSPVNLLYIFRTPFPMNISGGLLLFLRNSVLEMYNEQSENSATVQINF